MINAFFAALLLFIVCAFFVNTARDLWALYRTVDAPPADLEGAVAALGLTAQSGELAAGSVEGHDVVVQRIGALFAVTVRTRAPVLVSAESPHGERDLRVGDLAFDGECHVDGAPDAVLAWLDADTRVRVAALIESGAHHERGAWKGFAADLAQLVAFVRESGALTDRWPADAEIGERLLERAVTDVVDGVRARAAELLVARWEVAPPAAEDLALLRSATLPDELRARLDAVQAVA